MKNPYRVVSKVNPQKEKGDRRIANDVYNALIRAKLSGAEYQIILLLIDKTWGFGKHSDKISYSQMTKITGLTRPGVIKTIKKLEQKKMIVIDRGVVNHSLPVNKYLFNKHYDTWLKETGKPQFTTSEVVNPSLLVNGSILVNHSFATGKLVDSKLVNPSLPTKESITKATIQKKELFVGNQEHFRLTNLLKDLILQNDPKAKVPEDITKWVGSIEKLERIDKRTPEEIEAVIRWCQEDDFWQANILSTKKLRKQFPQLMLKRRQNFGGLSGKMRRSLTTIANLDLPGGDDD